LDVLDGELRDAWGDIMSDARLMGFCKTDRMAGDGWIEAVPPDDWGGIIGWFGLPNGVGRG